MNCLARCLFSVLSMLGVSTAFAADWIYAVRPGDTLISVAEAHLRQPQDWPRLQVLNEVADPRRLMPGSRLRIPVAMLRRGAAVAEVIHARGEVWRQGEGAPPARLATGDTVAAGDVLSTGDDSSVSLRFVDGSRLLLSAASRITLAQLRQYAGTGMAETVVRLHQGEVANRVQPQPRPAARYRIETERLNLGVRGTEFRAGVTPDGAAQGEVLQGSVLASAERSGRDLTLAEGYGTVVQPGTARLRPIALSPAPRLDALPARIEHLPARLAWESGAGAVRWRAQLFPADSDDTLLKDVLLDRPALSLDDLPDGHYRLRVRALADNGLEGLDGQHPFELAAHPVPPMALAPQDGQALRGEKVALRWSQPLSIDSYRLQIADDPAFAAVRVDLPALAATRHELELAPGQYFWRLASIDGDGRQGPFMLPQSFSLRPLPAAPAADEQRQEGGETALRWRAEEAGMTWRVQLARDADFNDLAADEHVREPLFRLPAGEGGTRYLRIQALDSDGNAGPFGRAQRLDLPSSFPTWPLLFLPALFLL